MTDHKAQVFAVIRIDDFDTVVDKANIHLRITVKEILPTQQDAVAEVERLNGLNEGSEAHYFWQATRYYPNGRSRTPQTSVGEKGG